MESYDDDDKATYIWKTCVRAMPVGYLKAHYAEVLRTRQRIITYKLNGDAVEIDRSAARDYLRKVLGITKNAKKKERKMTKFYEDPVYIEMCKKAEEIQRRHSFTDGDYLIDGDDDVQCWSGYDVSDFPGLPMKQIWLPRLDQLIDMLGLPIGRALEQLYHWDFQGQGAGINTGMDRSWEVMVLGYLMETKYKKTWNGSEWVKI